MGQDNFSGRTLASDTHRFREFEVLLNRFVSPERTFHQQQVGIFCERYQIFRKTGVRSIDKRLSFN
jgi:hypothetical protein